MSKANDGKKTGAVFAASAAGLFALAAGAATLDASLIQTDGLPSVGSDRFYGYRTATEGPGDLAVSNAVALAEERGVPLVMIWSEENCSHCNAFISSLNADGEAVSAYLAGTKAVFAFFKADTPDDGAPAPSYTPKAGYDSWKFLTDECKAQPIFPLYGFYHKGADGTTATWGTAYGAGTRSFADLKARYAEWVEANGIATDGSGGSFAAGGTEFDRWVAEAATEWVDVELVRGAADAFAKEETLVAGGVEIPVAWERGETNKYVRIGRGIFGGLSVGESLPLSLVGGDGAVTGESAVYIVEKETSNANPLWIGERTLETLAFGEWTCDLDLAKAKAAAADSDAYTLVAVQGSLWCPDCANVDANFLDLADEGGANRFAKWAASNKVALAVVDVPNYGLRTGTDPDSCRSPSLFTPEAYTGRGAVRSGRGWMSRKMVSADEARAMRARNHFLASSNTPDGGFHRPEDANAYRTGIPVFVLLDKAGRVAARLVRWSAVSPKEAERGKWDVFIKRFDEMLSVAGGEIENNHWSTTPERVSASAGAAGALLHADADDWYALGASAGASVRVEASGGSDKAATLSVVAVSGGEAETVASAKGPLSGLAVMATLANADAWYVRVSCANTDAGFAVDEEGSTVAEYALSVSALVEPGEAAAATGETPLAVHVTGGETYRFEGIADAPDILEPTGGDGLYYATETGNVELSRADGADEIVYQLWRPGAVSFAGAAIRVSEFAQTGEVVVRRSGGSSGAAEFAVRLVASDAAADGRYGWEDAVVSWADGESGARAIPFRLVADDAAEGDGSFTVALERVGGAAETGSVAECVVTVVDTDKPCFASSSYEVSAYANFAAEASFPLVNVRDGDLQVRVSRVAGGGAVPPGLSFRYDAGSGRVVLSGVPKAAGTYRVSVAVAANRGGAAVKGFETEFTITVADPAETNPALASARSAQRIAVYAKADDGRRIPAGAVDFAATSKGLLSAKHSGTSAGTIRFSGRWGGLDADGAAVAELVSGRASLSVAMDAAGAVSLSLSLPEGANRFGPELRGFAALASSVDFTPWKGTYNVAMPVAESGGETPRLSGATTVSLSMATAYCVGRGQFRYAGVHSDGTAFSGVADAQSVGLDGAAEIPLFARNARNALGAVVEIAAGGAAAWDDPDDVLGREVASGAEDALAYAVHSEGGAESFAELAPYGSFWSAGASPAKMDALYYDDADRFRPDEPFALRFGGGEGAAVSAPSGLVDALAARLSLRRTQNLTLSYSAKTGAVRGYAKVSFADGRTVAGTWRGVLTPGWVLPCECGITAPEMPFACGTLYFRERGADGKHSTKSIPVAIDKQRVEDDE